MRSSLEGNGVHSEQNTVSEHWLLNSKTNYETASTPSLALKNFINQLQANQLMSNNNRIA